MGRQLLFELLQDRAFFFLLNGLSRLSYKQVYKSRIDLIHYQISIAAKRFFVLWHRNGLCPCFVVTRDPPICILMLNVCYELNGETGKVDFLGKDKMLQLLKNYPELKQAYLKDAGNPY